MLDKPSTCKDFLVSGLSADIAASVGALGAAVALRRQFKRVSQARLAASVSAKQKTEKDFFLRSGPDALLQA